MLKKINKVIYFLSLLLLVLLVILIMKLNVIPMKYLSIAMIIVGIVYLIMGIVSFKTKSKVLAGILIILEIFCGVLFVYAGQTIYKTDHLIHNFTQKKGEEAIYYVIVHKNSSYKKLKDIKSKKVGTYYVNDENYPKVLKSIHTKVTFTESAYDDLMKIASALLDQDINAIVLSDFNKEILCDELEDFEDHIRIIHTEKVAIENKQEQKEPEVAVTKEPFNILISGIDTKGSITKVSRSDVNIVVSINPTTHEILLTSIPRDYYVQLHGTTENKDKLTHAGIYGIDMSVNTIADLLNIKIDYYVRVNFDTVVSLVDAIGGVDVYSDVAFTTRAGNIVQGINHLDGYQTLWFSRERKQFAEGDRKRGKHQEAVITAIIQKVSSSKILLTKYPSILDSLQNTFQTSIPADTIKEFMKTQLEEMPAWNIVSISVNGTGSYDYTYSMPGRLLYVMVPDQSTVDRASNAIDALMNHKPLASLNLN